MIFSISVLEHITKTDIRKICEEMYRLVTKDGIIVHTIDISPSRIPLGMLWYENLAQVGFKFEEPVDLSWSSNKITSEQILTEPLSIVYQFYGGFDRNHWKQKKKLGSYCYSSIIAMGTK